MIRVFTPASLRPRLDGPGVTFCRLASICVHSRLTCPHMPHAPICDILCDSLGLWRPSAIRPRIAVNHNRLVGKPLRELCGGWWETVTGV